MQILEWLYLFTTGVLVLAGVVMLGFALVAYRETSRSAMGALALGFGLVVLAAVVTSFAAFRTSFADPRALLVVNSGLTAGGFAFLVASLVVYEPRTREFVLTDSEPADAGLTDGGESIDDEETTGDADPETDR